MLFYEPFWHKESLREQLCFTMQKKIRKTKRHRSKAFFSFLLSSFLLSGCATTIPVAIPRYPKKKGAQLRDILGGRRNLAVVAAKFDKKYASQLGNSAQSWNQSIEAVVSKTLGELGYYKIVDLSNRKQRLQELAYSQAGLTEESLEIGRELQVHSFFVVRMTKAPQIKCKVEEVEDYLTTAITITARSIIQPQEAGAINTGRPTGVLYTAMFIEGRLSNLETGRSVSHFYSQTLRLPSKAGNRSCSAPESSFEKIIINAGQELARNLSPKMTRLSVPLMKDSPDLRGKVRKEVASHLLGGLEWAQSGDMDEAKLEWEEALRQSNNQSGGAIWNLGVYHWHMGNFERAEEYFVKIKRQKARILDKKKRSLLALFNREKKAFLK